MLYLETVRRGRKTCQQHGLTIKKLLKLLQDIQSTSITNNIHRNKQEPMEDKHDASPQ